MKVFALLTPVGFAQLVFGTHSMLSSLPLPLPPPLSSLLQGLAWIVLFSLGPRLLQKRNRKEGGPTTAHSIGER